MAAARPEVDVLAFEVYLPGVARTVNRLHETDVANVRLLQSDAVDGLTHLLGPGSVQEVWTFFPDPVAQGPTPQAAPASTAAFADLVATRLRPAACGGWPPTGTDYAAQMRSVLDAQPELENVCTAADGWAARDAEPSADPVRAARDRRRSHHPRPAYRRR